MSFFDEAVQEFEESQTFSPLPAGTEIYCAKGHFAARVRQTIIKGDPNIIDKIVWVTRDKPQRGDPVPLLCTCGGVIFSGSIFPHFTRPTIPTN